MTVFDNIRHYHTKLAEKAKFLTANSVAKYKIIEYNLVKFNNVRKYPLL